MNGAHCLGIHRLSGNCSGNAEIRHFYLSVHGNNHILGLNIPMNNMLRMGRLNALSHLNGNADGFPGFQLSLFLNIVLESNSVNQLHDNIVELPFIHYVVDVYNIRVSQPGRRLGLHLEFFYKSLVRGKFFL